MARGRIHIGTSGWHYRDWVGRFYPPGLPARQFLRYYATRFATVEINNSFYRLPAPATVAAWRDTVPPGFLFACKASRGITHFKKLKDPEDSCRRFLATMAGLGDTLGPILFQLPPRWRCDPARLADFLSALPGTRRYAFECRDESWFQDAIYRILADHDAAFCLYDLAGRQSPMPVTADFVYIRLHGPAAAYAGRYGEQGLKPWAARCSRWADEGRDIFCYFDNDQNAYAVEDATTLSALLDAQFR